MKIIVLLKHIFIPHDKNEFKPHIFREVGVSLLLFTSVFLLGSSAGSSFFINRTVLGAEIASSVIIDLTNESRLAYNQSPLLRSEKLDRAAELKGNDMASNEYFSHNSPSGVTPWYWLKEVGYNFLYAGENLAINFTDSSEVEKAWLESPTHRANIMNVEFREIGVAAVKGMYDGYPTIYIVQMFGTPAYGKTTDNTKIIEKKSVNINSNKIAKVDTPNIKGVSIKTETSTTTSSSTLEKIISTEEMAIVKNNSVDEIKVRSILPTVAYSSWYEKLLFNFSSYIDIVYKILLLLVAFSLVTMVLIEIRKQHYMHILYGISLLLLLTLFIYINQSFY